MSENNIVENTATDQATTASESIDPWQSYVSSTEGNEKLGNFLKNNNITGFEQLNQRVLDLDALRGKDPWERIEAKYEGEEGQKQKAQDLLTRLGKPGQDATDEQRQSYREMLLNELGTRPDGGEYSFGLPEGAPDDLLTDDFVNGLANIAYQQGIGQEGYQAMIDYLAEAYTPIYQQLQQVNQTLEQNASEGNLAAMPEASNISKDFAQNKFHELVGEQVAAHRQGDYQKAKSLQAEINRYGKYLV